MGVNATIPQMKNRDWEWKLGFKLSTLTLEDLFTLMPAVDCRYYGSLQVSVFPASASSILLVLTPGLSLHITKGTILNSKFQNTWLMNGVINLFYAMDPFGSLVKPVDPFWEYYFKVKINNTENNYRSNFIWI